MAALDRPSAMRSSTSRSRGREPLERVAPPAAGAGAGRRPRGRARCRPWPTRSHRVDELADVGDAVLQQVADAAAVAGEQLGGVALLDVLGEHEHGRLGVRARSCDRGADALVGVGRRHADVDDDDVGLVLGDGLAAAPSASPTAATTSWPCVGEQAGEPVPQEDRVLGDHDAHGSSTTRMVGPPGGLDDVAASRRRRATRSAQARAARCPAGSAPPTPLSVTSTTQPSVAPGRRAPTARVAPACLADVGRAPRRRRSRRSPRSAPVGRSGEVDVDVDRDRRARGQRRQRGVEPAVGRGRPDGCRGRGRAARRSRLLGLAVGLRRPARGRAVGVAVELLLAPGRGPCRARPAAAGRRRGGRARSGAGRAMATSTDRARASRRLATRCSSSARLGLSRPRIPRSTQARPTDDPGR